LWLHAARDRQHHPFAAEVRRLMLTLAHGRSYVCYSKPGSLDKMGEDFDATGHLSRSVFDEVGVPREADVYLCGPTRFMADMKAALATFDVAPERIHVKIFNGSESVTPGVVGAVTRAPHLPKDAASTGPLVSFARSGASPHTGKRRHTRAFWSWPKRVTSRSAGRVEPVFVTTVRAVWFRGRSSMDPSHSKSPPMAIF
jgi:ferredoxin-NADP reductase